MKRGLLILIVAHLAVGLVYQWATPIFEASDEGSHYGFVWWLARGNPLPVQTLGGPEPPWAQEGSQPPLYYLLSATLTAWIDTSDFEALATHNPFSRVGIPGTQHNVTLYRHLPNTPSLAGTTLAVHALRWFSLGLSALTLWFTFNLVCRLFPDDVPLAHLAVAFVAFNPMVLFINASVNNDNLLMSLSAANLLVIEQFMRPQLTNSWPKALGLGVLLGLAALTKVSGLVLWPMAALGVGWGAWQARDLKRFIVCGCLILAGALLTSGWWFGRNYLLYGEWLGTERMVAIAGPRVPAITLLELIRTEWYGFWLSYWGVFGAFTVLASNWVYLFFTALTLWAVAGGAWAMRRARQISPALIGFALFIGLTLASLIRWTLQTFASQGRLMFGAIAPLSILIALGILAVFRSDTTRRWVAGGLASGLALVALYVPLADIAPRYTPTPIISEADLPASLQPVQAIFGEGMELIGYTVDATPRRPGETQSVMLYWRARQRMVTDYVLALHLLGRNAEEVGKIDSWPSGGLRPTSTWQVGEIFVDRYAVPISGQAHTPTVLRLHLAVWEAHPDQQLPITQAGQAINEVAFNAGRIIPSVTEALTPHLAAPAEFEYGLRFLGLDDAHDGSFTLYWNTTLPVPQDYTVFAHLVDAHGQTISQADGPPVNGHWPTSAWWPDLPFTDARRFIPMPPVGHYSLELGFYDPLSGARLAAFRPEGGEWDNGSVVLTEAIEIK